MRFGRFAIVGLAGVALAAILSGCLVFKEPPTAKQIGKKPKVAVKFTICESDGEGKTNCPRLGNDGGFDPADGSSGRVLFGLRVPKGTKVKKQFPQRSGDLLATSEFVRDASYKRSLNQTAPKGDKYRYFGYISDETNEWKGDDDEVGLEGEFKVKAKVPKELIGKKFKVRPVVGGTILEPGEIDCGPDPFAYYDTDGNDVEDLICIDDPARDEMKNLKVKVKEKDAG